jgi:hypothetical protein
LGQLENDGIKLFSALPGFYPAQILGGLFLLAEKMHCRK